jgi:hypothetical protein
VVVSWIEASVSPSAAIRGVAAKSFRFVGATRIRHARQGGLSRRRSGEPAPGPTSLARETRVPTESVFTTRSLGRSVDGVTTPLLKAKARATDEYGCTTPVACEGSTESCTHFSIPRN